MTQFLHHPERKAPLDSAAHVIEIATLAADRLNSLDELVDRFTENMRKLSSDANLAAQKAVNVATRHAAQKTGAIDAATVRTVIWNAIHAALVEEAETTNTMGHQPDWQAIIDRHADAAVAFLNQHAKAVQ